MCSRNKRTHAYNPHPRSQASDDVMPFPRTLKTPINAKRTKEGKSKCQKAREGELYHLARYADQQQLPEPVRHADSQALPQPS